MAAHTDRGDIRSMLSHLLNFDFGVLDYPDFKEDSVREEIIAPLLRALGYAAHGGARVVRSPALIHPFVSIGSMRKKVHIFPDYLLRVDERVVCVIEAKPPSADILDRDHLSQLYSYAVHREVQSRHYAICNGRSFALFHVADPRPTPAFRFELPSLSEVWPRVKEEMSPHRLAQGLETTLSKDLGLHLESAGFGMECRFHFDHFPVVDIGRRTSRTYNIQANALIDGTKYAACFDFDADRLKGLRRLLPARLAGELPSILNTWPSIVRLSSDEPLPEIDIEATLSTSLAEAPREIYRPLIVAKFWPPGRYTRPSVP